MYNSAMTTFALFKLCLTAQASVLPSVDLPPALQRVLTDYELAWQKKDAKGLATLFAEDGFVLAGDQPPTRGRAAIMTHYTGLGGDLALRTLHYEVSNKIGFIIGGYSHKRGEPDTGKFTLTLRKNAAGRWMIVSDMDNGNQRR